MVIEDSSMGLVGLVSASIVRLLSQRRQSVAPEQHRFYVAFALRLGSTEGYRWQAPT